MNNTSRMEEPTAMPSASGRTDAAALPYPHLSDLPPALPETGVARRDRDNFTQPAFQPPPSPEEGIPPSMATTMLDRYGELSMNVDRAWYRWQVPADDRTGHAGKVHVLYWRGSLGMVLVYQAGDMRHPIIGWAMLQEVKREGGGL
ncbi:MAG: hypothetical protein AAGA96_09770 [Verrucomicrobiota bacterium]